MHPIYCLIHMSSVKYSARASRRPTPCLDIMAGHLYLPPPPQGDRSPAQLRRVTLPLQESQAEHRNTNSPKARYARRGG